MGHRTQMTDTIKLVLVGESQVVKSSLVMQFVKEQNKEFEDATIGAEFLTQKIGLNKRVVKFEIWNTAGQERDDSLASMFFSIYFANAKAVLVVYDITRIDTFDRAKSWVKELNQVWRPYIVIALAGNDLDANKNRMVTYEEANGYAKENGIIFKETSENNVRNANELFLEIAQRVQLKSDFTDSAYTNAKDEERFGPGHNGLSVRGKGRVYHQGENGICCNLL